MRGAPYRNRLHLPVGRELAYHGGNRGMSNPIYLPGRPRPSGEARTAIAYVPHDDIEQSTLACLAHADRRGYQVQGVIVGNWEDALSMALEGLVDVVVVARREHLPPEVLPRVEFAEDHERVEVAGPLPPPRRRRPRLT